MPELPEVETTKRGIEPHILEITVDRVTVRQAKLRWPIPEILVTRLPGHQFKNIHRRGKYLLLQSQVGTLIIHLGMSGSLRLADESSPYRKHDHVDIVFSNRLCLRFHDPRRFGCMLWTAENPYYHPLLASLGPEPLSSDFTGNYLYRVSRNRKVAIKSLLMQSQIVVGLGNIYVNEALFLSGIDPRRSAARISEKRMDRLCNAISAILKRSIQQGGTTLRDFVNESGEPGYFQQRLNVYNKSGEPCPQCAMPIRHCRTGQRSTFYCSNCQH